MKYENQSEFDNLLVRIESTGIILIHNVSSFICPESKPVGYMVQIFTDQIQMAFLSISVDSLKMPKQRSQSAKILHRSHRFISYLPTLVTIPY